MKRLSLWAMVSLCAALAGQSQTVAAESCDSGTFDGAFDTEVVVPQNWNCDQRQEFWFTDQGSQIIPYDWFLHLEQAGNTMKFSDPANMDRYRYLPQKPTRLNPDGLPIGFTKGKAKANEAYAKMSPDWLGMTCAACHTGQVEYQGAKFLIDGAPTMGDFESLFRDLVAAMQATIWDQPKFARFAKAVIAEEDSSARAWNRLRVQLRMMTDIRYKWNERNQGDSDYGHARLDAVGAIVNEIVEAGLSDEGETADAKAPVSYPFIWDTPQHDRVQWNGSLLNAGLGALNRNIGEVLGVFGSIQLDQDKSAIVATSIDFAGLGKLEGLLSTLQSPRWRDTSLPAIDQALADKGREEFKTYCAGCHGERDRTDTDVHFKATMVKLVDVEDPDRGFTIATDGAMALGFLDTRKRNGPLLIRQALVGALVPAFLQDTEGTLLAAKAGQPPHIVEIFDEAAAQYLAGEITVAAVGGFLQEVNSRTKPDLDPNKPLCFPEGSLVGKRDLPCYKARPLNGIWATAPYLHNGSVRTLKQLLLPAAQRDKEFRVGSREFDPIEVGFKNEGGFLLDTSEPGNYKTGHEGPQYGTEVLANNPEKLEALLEYLKTL